MTLRRPPARRQEHLHGRFCDFHRRVAGLRPGANVRRSNRSARYTRRGCGDPGAEFSRLLNHAYGNETERGRAVGVWAAGASLALTAGLLVGGVLIEIAGWRSIFLVNLPIGLGALWLTWRYATDTTRAQHRLDLPGQTAAIGMLGVLAGTIIEGGRFGWTNTWVVAGFAAFVGRRAVPRARATRATADPSTVVVRASDVCAHFAGEFHPLDAPSLAWRAK